MLTKAFLLMAGHAAAHMIMKSPPPFGNPDNGPLGAANFPCKLQGDPATFYSGVEATEMAVGTDQTLSFSGSAVHGGGSCQLAITSDTAPTASSQWQVILSIIGGCPSVDGSGPSEYTFQIPDTVAPGDYTFAWTWISKLAGQPEYYMNCSPIRVTGGAAKKREAEPEHEMMTLATREATLPGLFVGNMGDLNDCKTVPGTDPVYPNPGAFVQKPGTSPNYADVAGNCIAPGTQENSATGSGGGGGGEEAPTEEPPAEDTPTEEPPAETTPPADPPAETTPPVEEEAPATTEKPAETTTKPAAGDPLPSANFPSGFITTTSPAAGAGGGDSNDGMFKTTSKEKAPATTAAPPKTTPPTTPPPTTDGGSGSGGAGLSGACTEEGTFNCIGGSKYQQCAAGAWTALQDMAGGTTCAEGKSATLWARDVRGGRLHRRMRIEV
jgi:hypothetical protein